MKLGAVPTVNLPKKSHELPVKKERRHICKIQDSNVPERKEEPVYRTFSELCSKISKLKLKGWTFDQHTDKILFQMITETYLLSPIELIVDESLGFSCAVFGWLLPDDHELYKMHFRSVRNISLSNLLCELSEFKVCPGLDRSNKLLCHSVPCKINLDDSFDHDSQSKQFYRPKECDLLVIIDQHCLHCLKFKTATEKECSLKSKHLNKPAHKNAPLSQTHPNRVKLYIYINFVIWLIFD